jgi:hypothetical protein
MVLCSSTNPLILLENRRLIHVFGLNFIEQCYHHLKGEDMRARRALLYMPGDDRHKIEKALTLDVDCICMDMEDGVAFNRKEAARRTIAQALHELDFGRPSAWLASTG